MIEKIITYEEIQKANDTIKTTDIKGKDYAEVNQRIKAFRMVYPTGTIQTRMESNENGVCVFRCYVYDGNKLLGTGTAYEKENSTFINKTSYIENCETSAVGRALGMCGFGIDTSVASAEEVQNAMANQNKDETDYKALVEQYIKDNNIDKVAFCKTYKLSAKSTNADFKKAYEKVGK
jgi:galactitol-specific phosphotransferase system IIB component